VGIGLWASPALAQHEVTGEVTSAEDGTTLPGVNIVVKGTQTGTTTRSDGTFTLEVPSPTDTLTFSFVGYQQKNVPVEGRSELDVSLQKAVTALEEVVVNVGYQEQTVATTTGSVSQISGEELESSPTTNLTNTLKGTVPGVFGVTTTSRPGADNSNLLIRGASTLNNNSPLVVIDGVPGRQGGLARLNPSNIESVSVLKDASAAIYGSRAGNGVILVETKGGNAAETQINVNVEQSWNEPTVVPEMANASTWMQMNNEVLRYRENPPRFTQEQIENHRNCSADSYTCFDTDWADVALKNYAQQTTADASVTGGSEAIQYRVSLRALTEEGILRNSGNGYDQFGFRSSLNGDVTDFLTLSLNLHGRLENRQRPAWRGSNIVWEGILRGKPNKPAVWPNGKPGPEVRSGGVNPVVSDKTGYDKEKTYYFQSNLSLEADIPSVDGWSVEGTVAYDRQFNNRRRWKEPWTLYSWGDNATMKAIRC
jgi:TonB-linked SusC/RagA family outer membrane protein